jgi:TolB protein
MLTTTATLLSVAASAALTLQPGYPTGETPRPATAWQAEERGVLSDHVQLTSREEFLKAGEAYFSPDGSWIIFQAIEPPAPGQAPSEHYAMYVAPLERDGGRITGMGDAVRISREGAATTCGWFHPNDPATVIFGSTIAPPSEENVPGYQRGTGTYRWAFPAEMEIVKRQLWPRNPLRPGPAPELFGRINMPEATIVFNRPGYDAEGSYSPDGRHILYANVDMLKSAALGRADADLYVYDTETREHRVLVEAAGYDGGPFFGPPDAEGRAGWITYRSDRDGDNLLQLFITELEYADPQDPAKITGITREVQVTDNGHVNWCPYWDNDGRFLVYATSELGHWNYEVYAVAALGSDGEPINTDPTRANTVRVTHAEGFDGLPVFSPDGSHMMWTSQRGPTIEGESRPSSQLWIARVDRDRIAGMVHGATPRGGGDAAP